MASQTPDIPSSNPETYYDLAEHLVNKVIEESNNSTDYVSNANYNE